MQIRKGTNEDKKQLAQLLRELHIDNKKKTLSDKLLSFERYKDPEKLMEETASKYLSRKKFIVFVAEDNGELVGYICGRIKNIPHKVFDKEGYVEDWYVRENYRGKQVGKLLFDALVDELRKKNCTHIGTDTYVEYKKSIKIYTKLGFEKRLITFFKLLQ